MTNMSFPFVGSLVSCFILILSSCRQKEGQKTSSPMEQPIGKSKVRSGSIETNRISDFQKKRIRSSIESAEKTADSLHNEKSIQEFEQLLQSYPSDLDFLRELAVVTSSATQDTQVAFVSALVRMYRAGEYARLGELMDALKTEGVNGRILVGFFTDELVKQKDLAIGAYEELIANPSKVTHPDAYGRIAFGAARAIGYPEALARIPNIYDNWFGTVSANSIITGWTHVDPVAASTHVRDLPDSKFRNQLLVNMIEEISDSEDFEMARAWANYLGGDAKIKALAIVARDEARLKSRDEDRAKRAAEKQNVVK